MSQKPDFSPDSSGPYLRSRLIPKRPDPTPGDAGPRGTDDATGQQQQQPDPEQPRAAAAKSHLWFEETVVVPDEFRDLLVKYSHIPAEEVDEHVVRVVSGRPLPAPPAASSGERERERRQVNMVTKC